MGRGFRDRRRLCRLAHGRGHRTGGPSQAESGLSPERPRQVNFVLGNIQNHLDGVGGPDQVTIALVVHGQALKAFHAPSASPDLSRRVGQFFRSGLELAACGNTMKSQNVSLKDLLPGFISADKGGVVRLAELQSQGYLYLRP